MLQVFTREHLLKQPRGKRQPTILSEPQCGEPGFSHSAWAAAFDGPRIQPFSGTTPSCPDPPEHLMHIAHGATPSC